MMTSDGKNALTEAGKVFEEICARHGWDLADLAREAGYELETLQKAARERGGVTFSERMRKAVKNADERASKFAPLVREVDEAASSYLAGSAMQPPDETIDHLIDILRDYKTASAATQSVLLRTIEDLFARLKKPPPLHVERTDRSVSPPARR